MLVSPQIPLQLQTPVPKRFEDFIAGPNESAVAAIRNLLGQSGASLFLSGPPSSGKTHLLTAACIALREEGAPAWYLNLDGMEPGARALLKGLEGLVCFDGLHAVVGDSRWEEALFHCFNEVREAGGEILAASRQPLSALQFALPDLASRMAWGLRFRLEPLGEVERLAVLRSRARRLELDLPEEVESFLLRRISRDLGTLLDALEKLHGGARADNRRVTVPLARQVLAAELENEEAAGQPDKTEES